MTAKANQPLRIDVRMIAPGQHYIAGHAPGTHSHRYDICPRTVHSARGGVRRTGWVVYDRLSPRRGFHSYVLDGTTLLDVRARLFNYDARGDGYVLRQAWHAARVGEAAIQAIDRGDARDAYEHAHDATRFAHNALRVNAGAADFLVAEGLREAHPVKPFDAEADYDDDTRERRAAMISVADEEAAREGFEVRVYEHRGETVLGHKWISFSRAAAGVSVNGRLVYIATPTPEQVRRRRLRTVIEIMLDAEMPLPANVHVRRSLREALVNAVLTVDEFEGAVAEFRKGAR